MKPYYEQSGVTIYAGDALEVLRSLPDTSVHCCVTSPPYWGLRDYGVQGQLGRERTPEEYIARMVEVFAEVRRVLRDDGTLWLNIGDSYNSQPGQRSVDDKIGSKQSTNRGSNDVGSRHVPSCKPKDLVGIPWMLAFALREDGWYLRSEIIWAKPNPMPESVTDRPTKAHEQIFLLAKEERYFYDVDAIREPMLWPDGPNAPDAIKSPYGQGFTRNSAKYRGRAMRRSDLQGYGLTRGTSNPSCVHPNGRNKRSVWTVSTEPFPEAHFATFPTKLIEPCILAGCPAGGTVLDPFTGAGTTALVAKENGRKFVGAELNPTYIEIAAKRLSQEVLDLQESTA